MEIMGYGNKNGSEKKRETIYLLFHIGGKTSSQQTELEMEQV
jgi:hypothetical protein